MLKHTLQNIFLIAAVVGPAIGCKPKDPLDGMKFRDTYPSRRQDVITDPTGMPPVAVGNSPLAYMVDYACGVRVLDVESKKLIVAHDANAGDIVVIDAKNGIHIGGVLVKPGPLTADGRFGIFLDRK